MIKCLILQNGLILIAKIEEIEYHRGRAEDLQRVMQVMDGIKND